jgi:hypothetical protein
MKKTKISATDFFKKYNFALIDDALAADMLSLFSLYSLEKERHEFSEDNFLGSGTHGVYGDTLMESLLNFYGPWLTDLTGMNLGPAFSFYRVYRPGVEVKRHKGRESCDICASLCLGSDIKGEEGFKDIWRLNVDLPDADGNPERSFKMFPGEMLVYRASEVDCWRDRFTAGEGSWYIQVDLFFMNREGPYGDLTMFDGRSALGDSGSEVDLSKMAAIQKITEGLKD